MAATARITKVTGLDPATGLRVTVATWSHRRPWHSDIQAACELAWRVGLEDVEVERREETVEVF